MSFIQHARYQNPDSNYTINEMQPYLILVVTPVFDKLFPILILHINPCNLPVKCSYQI